jgi:PLP dependent protein
MNGCPEIRRNFLDVRSRIEAAARSAGRDPAEVRLVAVSKTFPAEDIAELAHDGADPIDVGENYIQEAEAKIRLLGNQSFRWHFLGHLQTNKARRAAELFHVIQSVDSVRLLQRLDRCCLETERTLGALVEVNLGGEDSKSGCAEGLVTEILEAACQAVRLRVRGFMVLPPWAADPELSRTYFRRLRTLRDTMAARFAGALTLTELSMGMSHDFEVAVQEGATIVRVGTAIFGDRPRRASAQ